MMELSAQNDHSRTPNRRMEVLMEAAPHATQRLAVNLNCPWDKAYGYVMDALGDIFIQIRAGEGNPFLEILEPVSYLVAAARNQTKKRKRRGDRLIRYEGECPENALDQAAPHINVFATE